MIAYEGSGGDIALLVILSAASGGARIDAWYPGQLVLRQVPDQIRRCA